MNETAVNLDCQAVKLSSNYAMWFVIPINLYQSAFHGNLNSLFCGNIWENKFFQALTSAAIFGFWRCLFMRRWLDDDSTRRVNPGARLALSAAGKHNVIPSHCCPTLLRPSDHILQLPIEEKVMQSCAHSHAKSLSKSVQLSCLFSKLNRELVEKNSFNIHGREGERQNSWNTRSVHLFSEIQLHLSHSSAKLNMVMIQIWRCCETKSEQSKKELFISMENWILFFPNTTKFSTSIGSHSTLCLNILVQSCPQQKNNLPVDELWKVGLFLKSGPI